MNDYFSIFYIPEKKKKEEVEYLPLYINDDCPDTYIKVNKDILDEDNHSVVIIEL